VNYQLFVFKFFRVSRVFDTNLFFFKPELKPKKVQGLACTFFDFIEVSQGT